MLNNDAARLRQMEDLFIQQTREVVQQMKVALLNNQNDEVGKLAHKIKASIDLMDVDSLKRPIRTLETMGKQHEPTETLAPLTDQVCHILEQVCQQLETSR
jgi:HPt (histidine-containing phosphotransfer) domain-containing protein